jgi:glycine betaine/choline ABC-type transport system substrate-binding protein
MEYFKADLPSGYSERLFLKVFNPNSHSKRIIELNMVKLDDDSQVLFLFKEVSIYNKLSKAKTTEKFSNILINSIAHNLFTPLNALIQLNKSMSDQIEGLDDAAEKNVQMIGVCL